MAIDLFSIGPITVHGYGLMIGLGFLVAVLLGSYRCNKRGLSADHFTSIAICVLLFGFLGGKILFIIVEYKDFFANPLGALSSSGFVVYGGIITGILSIIIYCRIKKLSVASYLDMFAPSCAINQSMGRIGCFMAGCCYGRETDSALSVVFPEGCLAPAGVKLIPTQLYSAAGMLLICVGLILYARKAKYKGEITGYYLLSYGIGRFMIEFFRNDYRGSVGVLSTSQFISIFTVIIAAVVLVLAYKKKEPADKIVAVSSDGADTEGKITDAAAETAEAAETTEAGETAEETAADTAEAAETTEAGETAEETAAETTEATVTEETEAITITEETGNSAE